MQVGANEFSPSLPLSATIREQRELSGKLTVKPLVEIISSTAYNSLHNKEAKSALDDPVFAPFFNPDTSGREYYQDGDVLVVKEDMPQIMTGKQKADKIYVLAVFEKSSITGNKNPSGVTFDKGTDLEKHISYLQVKNFCLVKENGEQAVDIAASWLNQPPDKGVTKRRIGLLPFNQSQVLEKQAEAVARANTILLTDARDDDVYRALYALGTEYIPPSFKWMGAIMVGVKSTQKDTDLANKNLFELAKQVFPRVVKSVGDLLHGTAPNETELMAQTYNLVKNLTSSIKPELLQILMLRYVTGRLSDEQLENEPIKSTSIEPEAQKMGYQILRRLERNVAASSLYFIWQLRHLGFDLFPGVSNTQLIHTTQETLRSYNKLYPKANTLGVQYDISR